MIEKLIDFVSSSETKIEKIKPESGIETLYYIFKAYNESKGHKYNIGKYIDFMNKFYNNPKHMYNPFVAKGKMANTVALSNKTAEVVKKYREDIKKLSDKLKEIYADKYDEYKKNKKHLYYIKVDEEGSDIIYNPYSGLISENKRFTDKYLDFYNNVDEEEGLNLNGIKRKYYLYLCALKIVKEKNQWKKTVHQMCNDMDECNTKCCHENKCASKNKCEVKKPKKKKTSDDSDESDSDESEVEEKPKKKAKGKKKAKVKKAEKEDYYEVSDIED